MLPGCDSKTLVKHIARCFSKLSGQKTGGSRDNQFDMDSKTVNKLIRADIWPILRRFGFTHFEARNAYAFRGSFINVVNFQSFNSYLAGGLGCTTFSFAVNLGVYVVGQPASHWLRRDKTGRLLPFEPCCAFRSVLRKRSPIDGFSRDDIFFIDPDGRSAGPCFNELRHLASDSVPLWFEAYNDLNTIIHRMEAAEHSDSEPRLDTHANPTSYSWNELKTVLLLLKHAEGETRDSAAKALESLNEMIGTVLDFSTIQVGRAGEERYAAAVRELWDRLGKSRPTGFCAGKFSVENTGLENPVWTPAPALSDAATAPAERRDAVSARRELWPILKQAGFSEFTDRLAHRISNQVVEVIEFLPLDPYERKVCKLPEGLFRIGLGIFWPVLRREGLFRRNRNGQPRPIANECHVSNWLIPRKRTSYLARTAFDSVEDAKKAIEHGGFSWLEMLRNPGQALIQMQRPDWELFVCHPMMRGYGADRSSVRLVYYALLCRMLGRLNESESYLQQADIAADSRYVEHLRPRYQEWVQLVQERFAEGGGGAR